MNADKLKADKLNAIDGWIDILRHEADKIVKELVLALETLDARREEKPTPIRQERKAKVVLEKDPEDDSWELYLGGNFIDKGDYDFLVEDYGLLPEA